MAAWRKGRDLHLGLLRLVAVAANLDAAKAVRLALGAQAGLAPGPTGGEVGLEPAKDELAEAAVAGVADGAVDGAQHGLGLIPLLDGAEVHVDEVGGPAGEVVEDVGGVDDGALARLRLALEPLEEAGAAEDVEVDGDLVEEEDGPGAEQAHGELDAAALAVGHGVHAPVGVDVEHGDELIATGGEGVAADGAEQLDDANVVADDGVEDPFEAEVGDALERLLEGVDAADGDGVAGREALAGEEPQQRRLARAVGADEQRARPRGQVERDVAHARRVVGERVRQVGDLDAGRLLRGGRGGHDGRVGGFADSGGRRGRGRGTTDDEDDDDDGEMRALDGSQERGLARVLYSAMDQIMTLDCPEKAASSNTGPDRSAAAMVTLDDVSGSLLQNPGDAPHQVPPRAPSSYKPLDSFALDKQRTYQQQYGDMYFLRLTKIKPAVDEVAAATWGGTVIGGEEAKKVDRVLDVRQGELCWVTGTVYMEMALKPDILEDVSKDRWISAPVSTQRYYADEESTHTMLEDDSGRVRLVGDMLKTIPLVTGCIVAVMGTENNSGEFEVIDIKFPDLPPQPERWAETKPTTSNGNGKVKGEDEDMTEASQKSGNKIAIVSGLSFSGSDSSYALELNLLLEYLLGEALGPSAQDQVSQINRLIIAGNSISTAADPKLGDTAQDKRANKKYGYDASSYNALPSQLFDEFVSELLPSMPVTLLPGAQDPANASYPQQPMHMALFSAAKEYSRDPSKPKAEPGWFDSVTNPFEAEIDGWRVLGTGGQNLDDVFKYIDSEDRLGMMEAMCRWRCCAPTAPDTLWSYPFQEDDPFVMKTCPHVYFVGCQPEFGTKVIDGPDGQSVRLITVPSFSETKEIALLDTETLEVTRVKIEADI
ncbi:microsomal signal peptidase subunit [Purpureocillium lavendulum]|uniref:DNA-directed DNA polymerase n=1 Tax=Purpureocillium lavendulum TaxID=1247861 RepID=A0AB34FI28_9HYPO|nr:microsomal signal peptidase subunit [Purpureocillium lavendulum]